MGRGIYRKPQWHKDKGIKLIRVGGLSHVRQDNNVAPRGNRKGLWAFIWPHFDWWFVSGAFSHKDGKTKDKNQWREHVFWHKGDIFTPIDLRTINPAAGTQWDDRWLLTDDKRLYDAMSKVYSSDLKSLKQGRLWGEMRLVSPDYTGNPYYGSVCTTSTDHMEVFIPRRKRVKRFT